MKFLHLYPHMYIEECLVIARLIRYESIVHSFKFVLFVERPL